MRKGALLATLALTDSEVREPALRGPVLWTLLGGARHARASGTQPLRLAYQFRRDD